jgi:hypothetical protein
MLETQKLKLDWLRGVSEVVGNRRRRDARVFYAYCRCFLSENR